MNEMTEAITKIKASVSAEEWRERIEACQSSGMRVKDWCEENGITVGTYYFHLRKLREAMQEESQIVSLAQPKPAQNREIEIRAGELQIRLPESASPEQLQAILRELKSC